MPVVRPYRCVATSVGGFVQQLAVAYVCRGYHFYSSSVIPDDKDPAEVDEKLIARYGIACSKWERARRKRAGIASVQYLRHRRSIVIVATKGSGRFFEEEAFRDFRRRPFYFAGYSISCKRGRDGRLHPSVRLSRRQMALLKAFVMEAAVRRDVASLGRFFSSLDVEPYAPVVRQLFELLRLANRVRAPLRLEPVPHSCLPLRRRVLRPFD
ncbi:hypothetical protein EP7_004349 [Isosphaeraceae bacterium EP7]